MDSISVIIPFYGLNDTKRLKMASESILSQKGTDIELLIGGASIARRIRRLSDLESFAEENNSREVPTGLAINRALKIAGGEYTYVTDSDIVFQDKCFFSELIYYGRNFGGRALKRPPMRRLLLEDFEDFYALASKEGAINAINHLDSSHDYVLKPHGTSRPMKVFPKFENGHQKIFIASEKDFNEYVSDEANKGCEPKFFNQDRHCGGTFAQTRTLEGIGGYCEKFISWGVWDADAQWKLENLIGMAIIPNEQRFEVIHLDHPKGYFDRKKWAADRELQKSRRVKGSKSCIKEDLLIYLGGAK